MTFYEFLIDLFQVTLDLDGSINGLSSYTISVENKLWELFILKRRKEVIQAK